MKCPKCKGKPQKPIKSKVEYRGRMVTVAKPNPCPNCEGRGTVSDPSNNTGFELATIESWPLQFTVRNNWRCRMVSVYDHPTDTSKLITVGKPFDGGGPAICVEDRTAWSYELNRVANGQRHFIQN